MIDSYFEPDRGQEWVRTYLLDAGITFSDDRRILETWLIGGRFPLQAVATGSEDLIALAKKGIPIKQIFLAQTSRLDPGRRARVAASRHLPMPPHPNAAKLFVNWFLSKEGQTLTHTLIPNIDRSSLRNDIPFGEVVPEQRRTPGVEYGFPGCRPQIRRAPGRSAKMDLENLGVEAKISFNWFQAVQIVPRVQISPDSPIEQNGLNVLNVGTAGTE